MSSFPVVKAESVTLLAAKETTFGVQPTASWQTLQPNQAGIGSFYAKVKTVAPSPLSKFRQLEAPQVVDLDATPEITHDWTNDLIDQFIEGVFLAKAKHPGGTGLSYFLPTARTTTDVTVPALGALQQNTLVVLQGFANAANNGLFAVGASSTGTAIKVAGGVAETVSGYVATAEVAGWRGASGDIALDASGNLTSTVADFTTMGLAVGQVIWVGGTAGTANAFATAAYRGFAKITAIAANKLTLVRRQWTVGSADTGSSKTIDLYWGRWLRNVAFDDADYLESSYALEVAYPNLSAGTTTEYAYALGNQVAKMALKCPPQNLLSAVLSFLGTTIGDPTTSRATGAATAAGLLGIDRYNSVTRNLYRKVMKRADESTVSDDIEQFDIEYMNNPSPQKQVGTLGSARTVVGKAQAMLSMTAFLTQDDAMKACTNSTDLMFGAGFRNTDGGFFVDMPSVRCTDAPPSFPANGPVTLALKMEAFRDATSNITMAMSLFPFLPTA